MLTPGKAKIASLPLKDANEMLKERRGKELIDAVWGAKVYRPEGIVTLSDIKGEALKPIQVGLPWVLPTLTKLTHGRRYGEIYGLGAGTGVGKTDLLTQQVDFDITELNQKVGLFFLEQQPVETAKRVAGKNAGRRFHVPDAGWTEQELIDTIEKLEVTGNLYMFDHFGTADWEIIEKRIRYLYHSEGVRIFYLDHLTALAAAEEDEKKGLERITADMGGLVKELDIMIILVSHLATPDGKPHEEGGRVMIRHFKGSRAIGFWCHYMFGLERNQQAEDEEERQTTTFRVLKDRYTGQATGQVFYLGYDPEEGRLFEKPGMFDDETGESF
jgi:twinkle protein